MNSVQTRKAHGHDCERSPAAAADFKERIRLNQKRLTSDLQSHYDFIVCGSGSSSSVVARRLAENRDVSVLLLEAGGDDEVPSVMEAHQFPILCDHVATGDSAALTGPTSVQSGAPRLAAKRQRAKLPGNSALMILSEPKGLFITGWATR